MKADFVFALETAKWPVLIMTHSGVIYRANTAAADLFSAVTETGRLSAGSIWSPENESSVEVFLSRVDDSTSEAVPLKLRVKSGQTTAFSAYIATFSRDGQNHYMLQLLKPSGGQRIPPQSTPNAEGDPERVKNPRQATAFSESNGAQKQKLECALQLARSVSLDFNNALTAILGHTSLILSKINPDDPWRNSLVEIERSAEKAAEVASDLAAFSRQEKDPGAQTAGNLNDLLRRTVNLFQGAEAALLSWTLELEPRLYTASFDEAKIQQAFAKILENAIQALPEGGSITVRTRNQEAPQDFEDGAMGLPDGHYVCIEFEDSGSGMGPDVLPRIFEPFFTTKKSPKHRGLGLALVYGIVTNHGGRVAVTSEPGRGVTARIFLPAQKKIVRERTSPTDDLNGSETILVVDDEELLLTLEKTVLSSFGYRVLTANSGRKAVELFRQNLNEIDLVITDLVMPQMSGREVIGELTSLSPGVKIICASGYVRSKGAEEEENYLQKPFTSLDLLRKVKQTLAASNAS